MIYVSNACINKRIWKNVYVCSFQWIPKLYSFKYLTQFNTFRYFLFTNFTDTNGIDSFSHSIVACPDIACFVGACTIQTCPNYPKATCLWVFTNVVKTCWFFFLHQQHYDSLNMVLYVIWVTQVTGHCLSFFLFCG